MSEIWNWTGFEFWSSTAATNVPLAFVVLIASDIPTAYHVPATSNDHIASNVYVFNMSYQRRPTRKRRVPPCGT